MIGKERKQAIEDEWEAIYEDRYRKLAEKIKRWTGKDMEDNEHTFVRVHTNSPTISFKQKKKDCAGIHHYDRFPIKPEYHHEWREYWAGSLFNKDKQ